MKQKLEYLSGQSTDKKFAWNMIKGLVMWLIFIGFSMFFGFWFVANGTLEEKATIDFYSIILLTFTFFVSTFAIVRLLALKFFKKKDIPIDFILHNPSGCLLNRIVGQKVLNTKRLFLISVVWGIIVALLIYGTGFRVIGMPPEYAVDPIVGKMRSAYLKANPTSPAENIMIFGFFEGLLFILLQKLAKIPWQASLIITVIVVGTIGFPAYHWTRYGEKETDLLSTAIFGTTNAGISALTGSLAFVEIWHQFNNYFGEMRDAKQWGISVQWFG